MTRLFIGSIFAAVFFSVSQAQPGDLPWMSFLNIPIPSDDVHTLYCEARVSVSDGLTYSVKTLFHDDQRAIFHRTYPDGQLAVNGIEGRYIWSYDGKVENEAPAISAGIVLSHQFHAQLLFFDRLHELKDTVYHEDFSGKNCGVVTTTDDRYKLYYLDSGKPAGMKILNDEGNPVAIRYGEWHTEDGWMWPLFIKIDDGERIFEYRFDSITINKGEMSLLRPPEEILTDEQKLIRAHRVIMDDHFFGRIEGMRNQQSDSIFIVSQGDVYSMSASVSLSGLKRIMGNRIYTDYDDLIRPIIKISSDGSQAWVIAQIQAKGIRLDEYGNAVGPLDFVCAWIELYEKKVGKWKLTGNVSNFRPDRK
jgi:hypothetical protein